MALCEREIGTGTTHIVLDRTAVTTGFCILTVTTGLECHAVKIILK